MAKIKKQYKVEKYNTLNEMRSNNMTLQELRFFSIYLSLINARNPETRLVRFDLLEFQRIMELSRVQAKDIKDTIDSLLCKIVHVPTQRGGFSAFQLFKRCKVDQDDDGIWFVEIDAHDDALPLMFEFKNKYFTYQLWNALRLKSANQVRMYELLKQYEKIGERKLPLEDLRLMLGIEPHEYPKWDRFRHRVLEACQEALAEYTDIKFTYEPIRKGIGKGTGRKITHVKFIIEKNENHTDKLSLENFINLQPETEIIDEYEDPLEQYEEYLKFYAEACDCEFSNLEMTVLFNCLTPIKDEFKRYHYLKGHYDNLNLEASKKKINNRFAYLKKMVRKELWP
ncbi:MAG: replication initiation protein [Treponema sp.]|nr:replication initiation protein [Treponema sp.]